MAAPKIIPYNVELRSVNPVRSFDRPKAYTNDLNSVEFQFKVLDMTSTELTTATAVTLVYMRDGSFFANPSTDVSRVGNVFSYLLKENEGNHAGVAQIQLVVTVDGMELASQLLDFEIINGLETKVAQEVMIYDWTTLTRDARAYIDQFVADEVLRDAQFDNAQFDRNVAFVATQEQRAVDFTADQDSRTATFNASEVSRTQTFTASEAAREQEFDLAEAERAAGYTADHSRAGTDHTIAVDDSEQAATDHTTAVNDHTLAGTDHTRAEADHTRADADSATVAGFNARVVAEETATAVNKISAVKGKTFSDVDARFEDVEADTTMMGTNRITNGDFSNGTTGWTSGSGHFTLAVEANVLKATVAITDYAAAIYRSNVATVAKNKYYLRFDIKPKFIRELIVQPTAASWIYLPALRVANDWNNVSTIISPTATGTGGFMIAHNTSGSTYVVGDVIEFKNFLLIDLTATFGAGKEPTAEQMEGIMAKFTNSWFDGTKNLFRANATLNKLMAVDARTEFEAKNLVTNGDFSNGTTDWAIYNATISASSNELTVVGTAIGAETSTNTFGGSVVGNKYYISGYVKSSTPSAIRLAFGNTSSAPHSGSGNYEKISFTHTATTTLHRVVIRDQRADGYSTFYAKNIIVIDLTATFGAGKEPTIAEMDRLMARFPNSWFDGVKQVQTIETLYQEKANKVQEAWITPTLLNGWLNHDVAQPLQYRKDEFGKIHFRGRVSGGSANSAIIAMPVGYKPIYTGEQLCSKYHTVNATIGSARVTYEPGGSVMIYTTSTISERFDLSALTFSAN